MEAFNEALANAEAYLCPSSMTIGRRYPILSVIPDETKYGLTKKFKVLDGDATVFTYVGKAYASAVTETLMAEINLTPGSKCLVYLGKNARNANVFNIV